MLHNRTPALAIAAPHFYSIRCLISARKSMFISVIPSYLPQHLNQNKHSVKPSTAKVYTKSVIPREVTTVSIFGQMQICSILLFQNSA